MIRFLALAISIVLSTALVGCDLLGIDSPEKIAAAREAEGKAIGGACRHAGRAIEDCYALNRRADKAAVFAGWRDMNDYMRENNLEPLVPVISVQAAGPKAAEAEAPAGKKDKEKDKGKEKEGGKPAARGAKDQGS